MILTCPHCETLYDLDPERGASGKFLCSRCQTTFLITPPRGGNGNRQTEGIESTPGTGGTSRRVVVAAEPGGFRELLCRVLENQGVSIRITADGEEALAWIHREVPDMLFASVFLRHLLGITLCERIREIPRASGTRVILMGHARSPGNGGNGTDGRFGEDLYLEDHLTEAALAARVRGILRAGSSQPGPSAPADPAGGNGNREGRPDLPRETEQEIRKLGRIAAEDLLLYNPAKASACHHTEEVEKLFSMEIRQGMALVKERYPGISGACDVFLHSLKENLLRAGPAGGN